MSFKKTVLLQFLIFIILGSLFLLFKHSPSFAGGPVSLPSSPTGNFTASGLVGQVVSAFLPIILGIGGFIAVIMIVISGIQFITSGGNPEAAAAARGRLTFAIIGFIIIILSYAILQIIDKLFLGTSGVV